MKNENNIVIMTISLILGFLLGAVTGFGISYLIKKNEENEDFTPFDDIDFDEICDDFDEYDDETNCYSF